MFLKHSIGVVIPAYNEAKLIRGVLDSLPTFVDQVVVVDDGSTDRTSAIVQSYSSPRLTFIQHQINRGVGAAIATGYQRLSTAVDIAIVMGGDGQMDVADLPKLIAPIAYKYAGYTKGNRLETSSSPRNMPWIRRLGNRLLSVATRYILGVRVRDSQCGYTALDTRFISHLDLRTLWPRYGYVNELIARLHRLNVVIQDVPVRSVYGEEISGIRWYHAVGVIPFVIARNAFVSRILCKPWVSKNSSLSGRAHDPM